jgi:hypothetical protein
MAEAEWIKLQSDEGELRVRATYISSYRRNRDGTRIFFSDNTSIYSDMKVWELDRLLGVHTPKPASPATNPPEQSSNP